MSKLLTNNSIYGLSIPSNLTLPATTAGRLQMIQELFMPRDVYDEDTGDYIETLPPVIEITNEELIQLLDVIND